MKLIVEMDVLSKFFQDKRRKSSTARNIALKLLEETLKIHKSVKGAKLVGLVDDEGNHIHEIAIDLYGVLKCVGALAFNDSKNVTHTLLVVDEGASYLLFELDGDSAFFQGALTGMELDGFQSSYPGRRFSYYRRVYKKLSDRHIEDIIDHSKMYRYETGEPFESPRKAAKPI